MPRSIACFVGRLHLDTTEQDLKDYLTEVGIKDANCRKLAAKDGRVFSVAAFYVSCSPQYCDLFYDDCNWPEGAELREWFFDLEMATPADSCMLSRTVCSV